MVYAVSDLHGCCDKFRKLPEMIRLTDDDVLYVLGDVVDRGAENVRLISELASRRNIVTLLGNHDYLARLLLPSFGMPEEELSPVQKRNKKKLAEGVGEAKGFFEAWREDGGETTWQEFIRLSLPEKRVVLRFLENRPLFAEIEAGGKRYFLSHTVPEKAKMLNEGRRSATDFLFARPEYDKVYFADKILVTGHTPTGLIDSSFTGRILRKNNHVAIDCGAVFGNPLGCICLDTGEEYYAK